PSVVEPKAKLVGSGATTAGGMTTAAAVPVNPTVTSAPLLNFRTRLPVFSPASPVGEKVTPIVHSPPFGTPPWQPVLFSVNPAEIVVVLAIVAFWPPLFVSLM